MLWRRGKAYSQDLRERVFAAADEGGTVGRIARGLRVSIAYVSKVLSRRRETGETAARPQRGHVPAKLAGWHEAIRAEVTARPELTVAELRRWLSETHGVSVSEGVICKTLQRLELTRKKRPCGRANRTVPMSPNDAANGARSSPASIRAS
jgi:transposase